MKYNEINNKSTDQKEGLFLVSTIFKLNNFLYQFHISTCHSDCKELKFKFYENRIWFSGLDKIIEDYVNCCPVSA